MRTNTEPWVHVRLDGHGTFWVEADVLRGDRHGALAPEHHMKDGELSFPECFGSESYAHVYAHGVLRFRQRIAYLSDLIPIDCVAIVEPEVAS